MSGGGGRWGPSATDIWWSSLETCSNLFTWGPTPPISTDTQCQQLKHIWLSSGQYVSYSHAFLFIEAFTLTLGVGLWIGFTLLYLQYLHKEPRQVQKWLGKNSNGLFILVWKWKRRHREFNLMFTSNSYKDQRKNTPSCLPSVRAHLHQVSASRLWQLYDDACNSILIENNGVAPEWGCNWFSSESTDSYENKIASLIAEMSQRWRWRLV